MKAYYSSQLTYQEEQLHIEIEIINIWYKHHGLHSGSKHIVTQTVGPCLLPDVNKYVGEQKIECKKNCHKKLLFLTKKKKEQVSHSHYSFIFPER